MGISDFLLGGDTSAAPKQPEDTNSLTDKLLTLKKEDVPKYLTDRDAANNSKAFVRGLKDVFDSAAHGLGYGASYIADKALPENISKPLEQSVNEMVTADKAERDKFDTDNPPSQTWMPTQSELMRSGGQIVGTAPLTPMRGYQAVKGFLGAADKSAPFVNKALSSAVTGGLSGAEFGALTSSANEKPTIENVGEGLISGAVAGPLLTTASSIGKSALPAAKNLWANVKINDIAKNSGVEPSAVKNIIDILNNAGLTPQQAQLELTKLGPTATLADLAHSIQTEASGIASFGGKPTEILKGRFEARAKTANSDAHNLMEAKLDVKPDLEAEKEKIYEDAQKAVSGDYKTAYANPVALDIQSVSDEIDKGLKTAVGPKANALKLLKSYIYKNEVDTNGNPIKVLKHNVQELHEIRMGIDDVLNSKDPKTSAAKGAKRALETIRNGIDAQLKTVPEMAAADTKFANEMEVIKHLSTGYDVLKSGMNKEEFKRFFDGLSPAKQELIKKGMRANIGDMMELSSRGELSEAQRLFGKNSTNRANVEKAFGSVGSEVLDALEKQAMFRSSEQKISHGAQTAERQSIQRKYGERNDKGEGLKDVMHGAILDVATGTPGASTAIMTAKKIGGHMKMNISEGRKERLIEGTADILSRQGSERDLSLKSLVDAKRIQDSIKPKFNLPFSAKLPTYLLSAPIGKAGYSSYRNIGKEE